MVWKQVKVPSLLAQVQPNMRCWMRNVPNSATHLTVFVGHEDGGWHLSISLRTNTHPPMPADRLPSWAEIAEARYRFVPDEVFMVLHLPPKEHYVNVHPTTMQLWESRETANAYR